MCFWDPYTPVKTTANGETGVAMIQYKDPEAIKASPEKSMAEIPNLETWGILSYDKALGVYIGIAFNPGTVDMEEAKKIAETIELTSVKITNGKDSRLLIGKSLDDLGLKATLPAGVKVSDPNYTKQIADGDYFNNVNGSGHWVMFDFLTAPVNGQDSMKVLNVCAFKLDAGESPLSYSYKISNLPDVDNIKTYKEIKPYIIYQDRYRIVVETSAFLGEDLRSETEKFIEQNRMTEPKRNADGEIVPSVPYADGTYLYKYDWLLDVYDTIEKNKKNLIVPEKQNTVPTEISDTFTYLWRSANEVYNVDSAELFEFGETVKLYDNSPEYTEIKNYDEVVNKIFTANGKNQLESTYLGGDKYTFIQKSGGKVYRLAPWKTGTSYVNSLYQVSYVDDISNGRATFEVKYKKPTANENAEPEIGTVEFILVNQNGTWLVDNYVYPEAVKKINSENAQGNVLAPLKTKAEEALISAVEKQYLENNEKVIVVDASISPNGKLKAYAVQYGNKPEAEGLFATDPEPTAEVVVEYNGKKRTIFKDNYSHSLQAFPCKLFGQITIHLYTTALKFTM